MAEPRCPSCDVPVKAKAKFWSDCGHKLDDAMGQQSEAKDKARENVEYCKEAALQARKALRETKAQLQQHDSDSSTKEGTIELEW